MQINMGRYENIALMNRELDQLKDTLEQIDKRWLLRDQTGKMLHYVFQDPIIYKMYPEPKAQLIHNVSLYLNFIKSDIKNREDLLEEKFDTALEDLLYVKKYGHLNVSAQNLFEKLDLKTLGDLLSLDRDFLESQPGIWRSTLASIDNWIYAIDTSLKLWMDISDYR